MHSKIYDNNTLISLLSLIDNRLCNGLCLDKLLSIYSKNANNESDIIVMKQSLYYYKSKIVYKYIYIVK